MVFLGAAVGEARLRAIDAPVARVRPTRGPGPPRPPPLTAPPQPLRRIRGGGRGGRPAARHPAAHAHRSLDAPAVRPRGRRRARRRWAGRPLAAGDGSGFADQLRHAGIAGELLLDRARATGRRRGGIAGALDAMRRRAQGAVAAGLPPPEAALARGMVLGQDEAIDETTRQDWRDSGLSHLLAVSGQNVMLLVALAMPLLALMRTGPLVRGTALLVLIALYVPLAGAGPSLQRAGVMGAAGIAAMTLSRPGVALVRAPPGRSRDPRAEPPRERRPRLAALLRRGRRNPRDRPPARRRTRASGRGARQPAPALAAGAARACPRSRRRRRDHACSHSCNRSARGVPLRRRAARRTAREPPRSARGRARDVARDGQGRPRASSAASLRRRGRSRSCSAR